MSQIPNTVDVVPFAVRREWVTPTDIENKRTITWRLGDENHGS